MENKPIARTLRLLSQLMELHDVNPFKIRSVANAAFKADKQPFPLAGKSIEELEKIDGFGKSIAAKVVELLTTGTIAELEELLANTPDGVVEMMGIKGIGPKKVAIIWKELGIENTGELYYACNENRLIEAKGFGLKTQEEIKKMIEFRMAGDGKFLYASNRGDANSLAIFAIDSRTGKLVSKGFQSTGGIHPRNFTIDPSGKFLLVANRDSNNIIVFSINRQTGSLTQVGKEYTVPNPVFLGFIK
ncbi:MAG: hypothetical protein EOO01_34390 [Chitinophagaceae bacterium]|nr:MAG: hypothetical protein EOO01_34390 [Chitinophagaceae bacterium]